MDEDWLDPNNTYLFDGISERNKNIIVDLAYAKNLLEISQEVFDLFKDDPESRLFLLYNLFKRIANPDHKNGITGISMSLSQYNILQTDSEDKKTLSPDEINVKIGKLTKEKEASITYGNEVDNYIIDRSDFCYTKINYFEKYEFSNNIAFELAKRSMYFYPEMEQTYLFRKIVLKFCSNEYQADLDTNLYQVAYCKYAMLDYDNFSELLYFFKNEKTTMDTIYRDFNCYFRTMRTFKTEEDFYLHTLQFSDVHNADWLKIKRVDEIRANFRAPILPESEFFTVDCRINMSLPEDELIDYIRTTKKGLIKLNKLKSINILELMFGAKHNYTSQISDLLFTYDAIRLGIKFPQVLKSIASYNRTIQSDIYTKDIRTLKKYFKYAKILIEEGYYRGIISSIYIGNLEEKIKNIDK